MTELHDGADLSTVKWPLGGYAPGSYMGKCYLCEERMYNVDKRARSCLACAIEELREAYEEVDRAFRIKVWNEAKSDGLSDRAAMDEIVRQRAFLSAKAMSARQSQDAKQLGPKDASAVANGDLPTLPHDRKDSKKGVSRG